MHPFVKFEIKRKISKNFTLNFHLFFLNFSSSIISALPSHNSGIEIIVDHRNLIKIDEYEIRIEHITILYTYFNIIFVYYIFNFQFLFFSLIFHIRRTKEQDHKYCKRCFLENIFDFSTYVLCLAICCMHLYMFDVRYVVCSRLKSVRSSIQILYSTLKI